MVTIHRQPSQVAPVVKNPPANAGDSRDVGSIPESGEFPGVENGNLLQYSWLGNPMDRGAWWPTVHGVAKSQTRLSDFTFTFTKRGHSQKRLSVNWEMGSNQTLNVPTPRS